MKSKVIIPLTLILCLSTCGSTAKKNNPVVNLTNITVLEHRITYQRKGTRSESRSGYLYYQNNQIPDCFSEIFDGSKTYKFISRNTPWGDDGYYPLETTIFKPTRSTRQTSKNSISQGWSESSEYFLDIPVGWIFVKYYNGEAWIDPQKSELFANTNKIQRLSRRIITK